MRTILFGLAVLLSSSGVLAADLPSAATNRPAPSVESNPEGALEGSSGDPGTAAAVEPTGPLDAAYVHRFWSLERVRATTGVEMERFLANPPGDSRQVVVRSGDEWRTFGFGFWNPPRVRTPALPGGPAAGAYEPFDFDAYRSDPSFFAPVGRARCVGR